MSLPASTPAPVLGVYDRCPRCHQARDCDVPCPNCGHDELEVALVAAPSLIDAPRYKAAQFEGQEVNGHLILAGTCAYCEASLEYALAHWCVGR